MPLYAHPTSIRLPKPLKDFLRRRADEEDRKVAQVIVRILEEYRSTWMKSRTSKASQEAQQ